MKTHDQFFLAQRAHNLLTPLINEAEQDGIKVLVNVQLCTGAVFGSAVNLHVMEVVTGHDVGTIAYSSFNSNESLKDWMSQLDGVVEHVRDALAARRDLMELAA